MSRWWCVTMLAALAAASGCGGKTCPPAAPTTSSDPAVARMMEHERATCACTTLVCAGEARASLATWSEGNEDVLEAAIEDTSREMQLDVHRGRADACREKLYDAATPEERLAASDPIDRAIEQFARLTTEACACKDRACAEQVMRKMGELDQPATKPSQEQIARVMQLAEEFTRCQSKLMGADEDAPEEEDAP